MNSQKINIITPSFNTITELRYLYKHLSKFDKNMFVWIIMDGKSNDETILFFQEKSDDWIIFKSELDNGIYDAINKVILQNLDFNDYYVVCGSDDLPNINNLHKIINDNNNFNYDIILGNVNFPIDKIKKPILNLEKKSKCSMSFHSVGTIINKRVHDEIGLYSTKYIAVSDELFFQRALRAKLKFSVVDLNFGFYSNSGLSAREYILVTFEMFYIRTLFYKLTFRNILILFLQLCKYKITK